MGHFAPYVKHTLAEEPDNLEKVLARDPDRRAACHENILARRRWAQLLDAAQFLSGRTIRFPDADQVGWLDHVVMRVEQSVNAATECFVLVTDSGLRISVSPKTEFLVESPRD